MFQSSSTASGMWRRQTSSACSPSSASDISKSRPSRIRRATLRITLESSTTRQFFIAPSFMPLHDFTLTTYTSCGLGGRPEVQYPIEIKDQHQLSVEPMHARADMRELAIEIDRRIFTARSSHFQHLADLIDQQSVG